MGLHGVELIIWVYMGLFVKWFIMKPVKMIWIIHPIKNLSVNSQT